MVTFIFNGVTFYIHIHGKKSDLLFLNLRSFLSMWLSTFYLQVFFFQFISMNIKKMCGKKIIVVNTDVCSKKLQLML